MLFFQLTPSYASTNFASASFRIVLLLFNLSTLTANMKITCNLTDGIKEKQTVFTKILRKFSREYRGTVFLDCYVRKQIEMEKCRESGKNYCPIIIEVRK